MLLPIADDQFDSRCFCCFALLFVLIFSYSRIEIILESDKWSAAELSVSPEE